MENPRETRPDASRLLAREISASLVEGRLSCPIAFKVAKKLNIAPRAVGDKANELGIRIINCQLGCFGAKKATHEELVEMQISTPIAKAIQASLVDGRIPCQAAYEVARKLKVSRRRVGDTATKLEIRISGCQLGCF
jgi:hypothetical protein